MNPSTLRDGCRVHIASAAPHVVRPPATADAYTVKFRRAPGPAPESISLKKVGAGGYLRVTPEGAVDDKGGLGPLSELALQPHPRVPGGSIVRAERSGYYLQVRPDGGVAAVREAEQASAVLFPMAPVVCFPGQQPGLQPATAAPEPCVPIPRLQDGQAVHVASAGGAVAGNIYEVKVRGAGHRSISLKLLGAAGAAGKGYLRVTPQGQLDHNGGLGPFTELELQPHGGKCVARATKSGYYLQVRGDASLAAVDDVAEASALLFPAAAAPAVEAAAAAAAAPPPQEDERAYTADGAATSTAIFRLSCGGTVLKGVEVTDVVLPGTQGDPQRPSLQKAAAAAAVGEKKPLLEWLQRAAVPVGSAKPAVFFKTPEGTLRAGKDRSFNTKGGYGVFAQWEVEIETGAIYSPHHKKYLSMNSDGKPRLGGAAVAWELALADRRATVAVRAGGAAAAAPAAVPAWLTEKAAPDYAALGDVQALLAHFKTEGYVVIPQAVAPRLWQAAKQIINRRFGFGANAWVTEDDTLNANSQLKMKLFDNDNAQDRAMTTTAFTAVLDASPKMQAALAVLLGEGQASPKQTPQVALRYPQYPELSEPAAGFDADAWKDPEKDARPGTQYHIDGMGQNKLCPFTLLVGVALSDQTAPNSGNLHVFPRSHVDPALQAYYRDLINDDAQDELDQRKPDLGRATQVLLRPGDVVIAHQLLGHRVGMNFSPDIRYQLFYRLRRAGHAEVVDRIMSDPWTEFPNIQ
eukprot:TRINITY_DN501_c0_g1_i3.p1 TRINITY_DN501_c0_g1~~TRINITY_DN501_c0_g1_i3.p1  ORF type:complete len:747 (+),score=305.84 TRINITY_DN501_c0_g1_i3:88-2328(+)